MNNKHYFNNKKASLNFFLCAFFVIFSFSFFSSATPTKAGYFIDQILDIFSFVCNGDCSSLNDDAGSEAGFDNVVVNPNLPSTNNSIANIALTYVGKNTGKDCSGFAKKVLNQASLTSSFRSGSCSGKARGSYGMYLTYAEKNRIVWKRSGSTMSGFPGNCSAGDLIFYTKGSDNTCVRHVAVYVGNNMIVDTTIANHWARYRAVTAVGGSWIPLACARPY